VLTQSFEIAYMVRPRKRVRVQQGLGSSSTALVVEDQCYIFCEISKVTSKGIHRRWRSVQKNECICAIAYDLVEQADPIGTDKEPLVTRNLVAIGRAPERHE
jgi:hypothetical protein